MSLIIPVKCFTCGNVISNRYRFYITLLNARDDGGAQDPIISSFKEYIGTTPQYKGTNQLPPAEAKDAYINERSVKTRAGHIMDFLGFDKMCCRRHILTQVDMD
jgi:DNA-directed RNA polymerase subunit N (RpoN/RPB10)